MTAEEENIQSLKEDKQLLLDKISELKALVEKIRSANDKFEDTASIEISEFLNEMNKVIAR